MDLKNFEGKLLIIIILVVKYFKLDKINTTKLNFLDKL